MTRAQRSAHRVAWSVVGLLATSLALWALVERAGAPVDASGAHATDSGESPPGARGELDR